MFKIIRQFFIFFVSIFVITFTAILSQAQSLSPEQQDSTQSVIRDQLSAFQSGDHERAFSHAAPHIKRIFKNTENFIKMVKNGYSALYDPEGYIFNRNRIEGETVFQEVIATDRAGKQWQAIYSLVQQDDGTWKISGVQMNPYNGAST